MGSKFSRSDNEEVKIEPQFWGSNIYSNSKKNNQYDCEILSTTQNTQTQDITDNSITQAKPVIKTENQNEDQKFPYKFEYKGLGSSVILTGSFLDDWKEYKPMVKNPDTDIFELVEYLTKTKHFFKFIVDNKWVCSNQYPTTNDNSNNQNNFVDLVNYTPPEDLIKREEIRKGEIKLKPHRSKVIILDKNKTKKNNYDCKYPLTHELNSTAPSVIEHYMPCFNLDYISNQDKIAYKGKKKYLLYKEKNHLTENNTYKKILPCPHEKLMHFFENIDDIKDINKRYIKVSSSIRNKHKYLTVIYYKPRKTEKK